MRAVLALVGGAAAAADWQSFRDWQTRFEVQYESKEEEARRYPLWRAKVLQYGEGAEQHLYADRQPEEMTAPADLLGATPNYPYTDLPDSYVKKAVQGRTDWRTSGCVTTPKNQGSHGYCGTFMRVAVAESQFALHVGPAANLSTEQLVDCVGWNKNQKPMMINDGLMSWEEYPYVPGSYKNGTPPCRFDKTKVVGHGWSNMTTGGSSEDQLAAFLHKNGPVGTGINADVFYHVDSATNFVTMDGCKNVSHGHNHAVTIVGFDTDSTHGEYWIIKNSWGSGWRDHGFVYMPRNVYCGGCCKGAQMFTVGDPAKYYQV